MDELIKALRCCADTSCIVCPRRVKDRCTIDRLCTDAADALEAAEKRIAELSLDNKMLKNTIDADKGVMLDRIRFLEAQLPKEGEWIYEDLVISFLNGFLWGSITEHHIWWNR